MGLPVRCSFLSSSGVKRVTWVWSGVRHFWYMIDGGFLLQYPSLGNGCSRCFSPDASSFTLFLWLSVLVSDLQRRRYMVTFWNFFLHSAETTLLVDSLFWRLFFIAFLQHYTPLVHVFSYLVLVATAHGLVCFVPLGLGLEYVTMEDERRRTAVCDGSLLVRRFLSICVVIACLRHQKPYHVRARRL